MKKCSKTMSGKHRFNWRTWKHPLFGFEILSGYICDWCGIINDLPKRKKI